MRKSTPPSFWKISLVVDGKAVDKIEIPQNKLKMASLKNIATLPWKDIDKTPLFISTSKEANDFFRKNL